MAPSGMRTAHKSVLRFGLMAIPLRLGNALGKPGSTFHQVHTGCGGRIRQHRKCETCQAAVDWGDVGKGIELPGGTMAEVTDEEITQLRAWEPRVIQLEHFCQATEVDPMLRDEPYYIEPDTAGMPAAALLAAAMGATEGLAGVCTVAFNQKVVPGLLEVHGTYFSLTLLRWPEELRPAAVVPLPAAGIRKQERDMAARLVKTMTRPFNPAEHVDTYRQALVDLVGAKADGTPTGQARPKDPAQPYADMMGLLQASIDQQKQDKPARRRATAKAS